MTGEKDKAENAENARANQVSVYGSGLSKPLLKTRDARLIQIRDSSGEISAMFIRLTDRLWGFTSRGDADWNNHLRNVAVED